jgi:hypothetical protein
VRSGHGVTGESAHSFLILAGRSARATVGHGVLIRHLLCAVVSSRRRGRRGGKKSFHHGVAQINARIYTESECGSRAVRLHLLRPQHFWALGAGGSLVWWPRAGAMPLIETKRDTTALPVRFSRTVRVAVTPERPRAAPKITWHQRGGRQSRESPPQHSVQIRARIRANP